jgi:hypothetical protein
MRVVVRDLRFIVGVIRDSKIIRVIMVIKCIWVIQVTKVI